MKNLADVSDIEFAAGLLGVIAAQWRESATYYERSAERGNETESYKTKREHSVAAADQIQGVVDRLNAMKDETLVDEVWLRSVGFKHKHYQRRDVFAISFKCPIGDPQWIETTELPGAFLLCRHSPMYDERTPPDRISVSATTRGDLRRLLAALGIKLEAPGK